MRTVEWITGCPTAGVLYLSGQEKGSQKASSIADHA